ncbi:GyrI-like domain-containing protein [Rothia sp. LK2588]|uniref:GyrI-like domain-containing protein n=1 Tax=Rothia sp. LK2588 TaxID=3114369 RepID=UPI0034CF8F2A
MSQADNVQQADSQRETALIEYGDFLVAGVTINATEDSDFAAVWGDLFDGLSAEQAEAIGKLQRVGVMMPDAADTGFTYTAGFIVQNIAQVAALGLTGVVVPGAMYATVLVHGPVSTSVREGFAYLHERFIPRKGLTPTGVNLEVYGPGEPGNQDYRMYCWSAVTGVPQ